MQKSLKQLIQLAKETGDRVIIHDSCTGESMVLMEISQYERLVSDSENRDVRELSSEQLLDQINRDIAIWRSDNEQEEQWEREQIFEDELMDEMLFDYSAEPLEAEAELSAQDPADWHHVSDVIEDRPLELDEDFRIEPHDVVAEEAAAEEIPFEPFTGSEDWEEEPVFLEEPV